jgi:hypothetical protein
LGNGKLLRAALTKAQAQKPRGCREQGQEKCDQGSDHEPKHVHPYEQGSELEKRERSDARWDEPDHVLTPKENAPKSFDESARLMNETVSPMGIRALIAYESGACPFLGEEHSLHLDAQAL